jgi:hypothetical protein
LSGRRPWYGIETIGRSGDLNGLNRESSDFPVFLIVWYERDFAPRPVPGSFEAVRELHGALKKGIFSGKTTS